MQKPPRDDDEKAQEEIVAWMERERERSDAARAWMHASSLPCPYPCVVGQRSTIMLGFLLPALLAQSSTGEPEEPSPAAEKLYAPWNAVQADYKTLTLTGDGQPGAADGSAADAGFSRPVAAVADSEQGHLYVADKGNHRIRRINIGAASHNASDFVSTLAGGERGYADGIGAIAKFDEPTGLAIDPYTRILFVADSANYIVRKIDLRTGQVTTLAGSPGLSGFANGRGEAALFSYPTGLALGLRSRQLFVCDPFNHAVRVVHVESREVHTLAGKNVAGSADGPGSEATFHRPEAAAIGDEEDYVYVADGTPRVRLIKTMTAPAYPASAVSDGDVFSSEVSTLFDGAALGLQEVGALSLAIGWPGGALMLADTRGHKIYRLGLGKSAAAPPPPAGAADGNAAGGNGTAPNGASSNSTVRRLQGGATVVACPQGVPSFAKSGQECHPQLALLAGSTPGHLDGMGINTRFYRPTGLAVEYLRRALYVADSYNHRIRVIDLEDIPDEVVVDTEEWYELVARAFQQNLLFIIILCSSVLLLCCLAYLCCRFCSLCPMYQRKLHGSRMKAMEVGSRA